MKTARSLERELRGLGDASIAAHSARFFKTGKGDGKRDVLNGLEASGRYLRLDCLERGTEHGFSIWEFQVFPEATDQPDALKNVLPADFTYQPPVETGAGHSESPVTPESASSLDPPRVAITSSPATASNSPVTSR